MVNLLEYQGKRLFKKYGIAVPESTLARSASIDKNIKFPLFLKAQVPTGHRKKLGGVVKITDRAKLKTDIEKMKTIDFNGFKAKLFLLEKPETCTEQLYVSILTDRRERTPLLLVSKKGGIDIESVDKGQIYTYSINRLMGIPEYVKQDIITKLGINEKDKEKFNRLLTSLWNLYTQEDAELVEINPLGKRKDGFIALDSKVVIDDDALFRHKHTPEEKSNDKLEREAAKEKISFVRLGGDIGLIANGAGLTMATIDMIEKLGGNAGDFLDLGGTDEPAKVVKALSLVSKSGPKVLLINIFGGVTKADTVAKGIVEAVKRLKPKFGIIVRLSGFNTEEGKKILLSSGIKAFDRMDDAVGAAVNASKT